MQCYEKFTHPHVKNPTGTSFVYCCEKIVFKTINMTRNVTRTLKLHQCNLLLLKSLQTLSGFKQVQRTKLDADQAVLELSEAESKMTLKRPGVDVIQILNGIKQRDKKFTQ